MTLHAAIRQLLEAAGLTVHDQTAPGNPPTPYVLLRSSGGNAAPHRLGIRPHWVRAAIAVLAVSSTPDGCRATAARIRAALTGQRPTPTSGPLREMDASTILTDGQPPADPRYSITVNYRVTVLKGDTP